MLQHLKYFDYKISLCYNNVDIIRKNNNLIELRFSIYNMRTFTEPDILQGSTAS